MEKPICGSKEEDLTTALLDDKPRRWLLTLGVASISQPPSKNRSSLSLLEDTVVLIIMMGICWICAAVQECLYFETRIQRRQRRI
jgi:hypothetical protein